MFCLWDLNKMVLILFKIGRPFLVIILRMVYDFSKMPLVLVL